MLRPCPSGSKQILIRILNDLLQFKLLPQTPSKLQAAKVGGRKKIWTFWVQGYIFLDRNSELLLFGRPGFDSRQLQTLKAHNFVALGPTGSKTTFFERSDLCLLGNRKKIGFAGLLRVLLIGQSTIKLYHKKQIDPERLAQTV